ncbi:acetate kinase [Candidatus Riesia pediculischaeffi]|uniref:Acetate kinase n=1 Tax=Candidatus Riesia pediculischaeffi PTSU TaxID=1401651 RepID=A0A0C1V8P0_9ENTR|nr:acetate kinase [Candidatus Riesia pediculischaeffi]KIE64203.1 Acetate kinase [Candidatus Riesia pediculischaeffi PTSU]
MSKKTKKYIFVLNCGSSSLKFAIIDILKKEKIFSGIVEFLHSKKSQITFKDCTNEENKVIFLENLTYKKSIEVIFQKSLEKIKCLQSILGIGHRIVHGGEKLHQSTIIDKKIIEQIRSSIPFAPLHNPFGIIGFQEISSIFPHLKHKQVAVFDTAFHHTIPSESYLYAIPYELYKKYGIRRYGAHGISYQYVSKKFSKIVKKDLKYLNIIVCHLGNGGSIVAIANGKSVDTSMGLTPLEGLMMGTRSGDIDPSIIFYLYENLKMNIGQIREILTKKSGILGITQINNDMRYVEDNYHKDTNANRAMKMYCHRLSKYIASYFTMMNDHLDAIIFTGGIGENSVMVRKMTMEKLKLFNVQCDEEKNANTKFGKCEMISSKNSIPVWVIPTNEEIIIAEETFRLLEIEQT